jgi:hypothetical protein
LRSRRRPDLAVEVVVLRHGLSTLDSLEHHPILVDIYLRGHGNLFPLGRHDGGSEVVFWPSTSKATGNENGRVPGGK